MTVDYRLLYGSEYITAIEFNGKTPTLTITAVTKAQLAAPDTGEVKTRGVIKFKEIERGMVANRTNLSLIAAMFGNDTDNWIGKRITLRAEEVQVGPKKDMGIRVCGSPDIDADVKTVLVLPRKKPKDVILTKTPDRNKAKDAPQPEVKP